MSSEPDRTPEGSVYDWFQRAQELLASGNADAALQLLYRVKAEDSSTSVLESLGRALFDSVNEFRRTILPITGWESRSGVCKSSPWLETNLRWPS